MRPTLVWLLMVAGGLSPATTAQTEPVEWEYFGLVDGFTLSFYPGVPGASPDTLLAGGLVFDELSSQREVMYRRGLDEPVWTDASAVTLYSSSATLSSGCILFGNGAGPRGIVRTCDGGRSWSHQTWANTELIHVFCLLHRPSDGTAIGCNWKYDDLVISDDDGLTWTRLRAAFPGGAGQPVGLAEHPTAAPGGEPRLVAGLQGYGYAYSDDGGLTWTRSSAWNAGQFLPDDLAVDQINGTAFDGRLYAMTNDGLSPDPRMGEALLASDDGATWWLVRHFPTGFGEVMVASDGSVWVGTWESAERKGRIWRSEDGGATWDEMTENYSGLPISEIAQGSDGRIYLAGGFSQGGSSTPGGGVWRTVTPVSVAATEPPQVEALRLTAHPNPSRQTVTLELAGPISTPRQLAVLDAQGREVARTELMAGSSWRLDVSDWAPGVYFARTVEPTPSHLADTVNQRSASANLIRGRLQSEAQWQTQAMSIAFTVVR